MNVLKIKWKYVLFVAVMVLFCISFMGCEKKGDEKLVGKWESVRISGEILIFNDDGTYMYTAPNGNDASGSYKVSENEIQMTSDASGLGADLNKVSGLRQFTVDGKTLTFQSLGFASTEYTKIK